jgi:hypothetical protein
MNDKPKNKSSGSSAWIVRGLVFGGLGVLLVLAFLDYQQRQNASKTILNFDDHFESNEFGELKRSDAEKLIAGSPESSVADSQGRHGSFQVETLTWKGMFRESQVLLYLGLPMDDPTVVHVERAGADAAD